MYLTKLGTRLRKKNDACTALADVTLLVVNCRRIKNKAEDFHNLLCITKPSVLLGMESRLDEDITNKEVFPNCYRCFRNDRNRHGGGVFIPVDSMLAFSALDIRNGRCEDMWYKIRLPTGKPLSVCSFYRAPTNSTTVMSDFSKTTETVNTDYLALGGDFNIPELS